MPMIELAGPRKAVCIHQPSAAHAGLLQSYQVPVE